MVGASSVALLASAASGVRSPVPESRVAVIMYHHVGDWGPPDPAWAPWVVRPEAFEMQLDWLQLHGYHAITMRQLLAHREHGEPLPPKPVMITFDDGWGEDAWIARRFLDPRGMPAVFFVYTGAVDAPAFLTWADIAALEAAGHEVLSHTVSHPDLMKIDAARLAVEMRESRATLEARLGHPVVSFAYPFGSYDARVVQAARDAGYRMAVAADGGNARDTDPMMEIPRWKVDYREPIETFARRLQAR